MCVCLRDLASQTLTTQLVYSMSPQLSNFALCSIKKRTTTTTTNDNVSAVDQTVWDVLFSFLGKIGANQIT